MNKCKNCASRLDGPKAQFCSTKCRVYWHRSRNKPVTASDRLIVSLCDYTGAWLEPYKSAGYKTLRIDLKNGQDVRLLGPLGPIHGLLAAPPCTYFSLARNRYKATEEQILDSLAIVDACLRVVAMSKPRWWALENPRGRLAHYLGSPRWTFQPWQYGDGYTKFTCLWGDFNPPQYSVFEKPPEVVRLTTSVRDPAARSITPRGFARAFFEANP